MVDKDGKLPSDPKKHVLAFGRPRWDGPAYIVYAKQADIERTLEQEKFANCIVADEQVAFRMVTRDIAREHILIASARHRDPISLVTIHRRWPELSREDFRRRSWTSMRRSCWRSGRRTNASAGMHVRTTSVRRRTILKAPPADVL